MTPLPRHVWAQLKPNGRRYLYFEKHRATELAWPRVSMPMDPASEEFARRIPQLDRLEASKSGDTWSWRFLDISGRRHDLPEVKPAAAFWAAVDKAEDIGKRLAAGERKTFSALIVDFKNSAAYLKDIGDSTRDGYDRHMDLIEASWGDDPVTSLTTEDAQKAVDSYRDTPAAARVFRSTLSRIISWGIPRGYSVHNVIEKTERIDSDGTYDPWPTWAFELFFEKARLDIQLPVYSALFTGQRKVDVLKMQRPADAAAEMPLVAQKTNELVPVQIHSEYRALITAAAPKLIPGQVIALRDTPQLLHLRADGKPWSYEGFKTAWGRQLDRDDFKRFREARLVFHGLRKNAVNMLLEVGCSEARVAAIVGMSEAMVHHYSLKVDKFRLARGAMKMLEAAWSEHRVHVLGNVKQAI